MTIEMTRKRTVDIKFCCNCGSQGCEHDHFCKRCGARQTGSQAPRNAAEESIASSAVTGELKPSSSVVTAPLVPETVCHKVSGPLVKSVTASLSANPCANLESNLAKRVILMVILLPVWLFIVLLSPIDAYVVARTAVGQRSQAAR